MNKDYKSLYFYLAGQMVTSAEVLETATVALDGALSSATVMVESLTAISGALTVLKDKIIASQKRTEEMIANGEFDLDDDGED
jgi:uncharacterized protein YaiE (UPF0345 family)